MYIYLPSCDLLPPGLPGLVLSDLAKLKPGWEAGGLVEAELAVKLKDWVVVVAGVVIAGLLASADWPNWKVVLAGTVLGLLVGSFLSAPAPNAKPARKVTTNLKFIL